MTPDPSRQAPSRVLVVDDEHLVAAGTADALTGLGYQVVGPVADADSALRLASASDSGVDLALVDIRIPDRDGLDLAADLWARHGIPCIIVSAYTNDSYIGRAQTSGVFGYLLKPVGADSLNAAVSISWARFTAMQALSERVTQLEGTLNTRKVVEQAKWHLVATRGMTEPEAHNYLQRTSRNARRPLIDVAREVVADVPRR